MTYDDSFFERTGSQDAAAAEYLRLDFERGFDAFSGLGRTVLFLGSVHDGVGTVRYEAARLISHRLVEAGFTILSAASAGGGIMEAANRGALEADGRSVGCTVAGATPTVVDEYVGLHIQFDYYVTRRTMFVKYADGFVLMPGGLGTVDQLLEVLALVQKNKVRAFPVVLFGTDYWQGLLAWIRDTLLVGGELDESDLGMITVTDDPAVAVAVFAEP